MKRCPNCQQSYSDDLVFCLNDGTVLENSAVSYSGDTPTVIVPLKVSEKSNKSLFAVIGAMALAIIGLVAVVFFLVKSGGNIEETKTPNVAQNQTNEKSSITKEAVQELINRWEKAQDTRSFDDYKACYATAFSGIKRTKTGSENEMNYAEWLKDREKMAKNIIDVRVENLNISIESDTATAQFTQHWKSANYQDTGQKTMRIKMFDGAAKIVYEDLKFVYSN